MSVRIFNEQNLTVIIRIGVKSIKLEFVYINLN